MDFLLETTRSLKEVLGVCFISDSAAVLTELALRELFLLKVSWSSFSRDWRGGASSMSIFCMEMRE